MSRYRYPPLFLRPRSPPSTRLPQSPSVRDWSTHSGTKFPHWSDTRLFNPGVEEERCWGSTPLVQTATLRAGSRISSSRDVTGVHETVGWFLRRDEIARSLEHYFFFSPSFIQRIESFSMTLKRVLLTGFLGQAKLVPPRKRHGSNKSVRFDTILGRIVAPLCAIVLLLLYIPLLRFHEYIINIDDRIRLLIYP